MPMTIWRCLPWRVFKHNCHRRCLIHSLRTKSTSSRTVTLDGRLDLSQMPSHSQLCSPGHKPKYSNNNNKFLTTQSFCFVFSDGRTNRILTDLDSSVPHLASPAWYSAWASSWAAVRSNVLFSSRLPWIWETSSFLKCPDVSSTTSFSSDLLKTSHKQMCNRRNFSRTRLQSYLFCLFYRMRNIEKSATPEMNIARARFQ